jgi:hypothetical protein
MPKKKKATVSPDYLSDVTGTSGLLDFAALVKGEGLLGLLPAPVAAYAQEVLAAEEKGVHEYLCHLDRAADVGEKNACGAAKQASELAAREQKYINAYGWIEFTSAAGEKNAYDYNARDGRWRRSDKKRDAAPIAIPNGRKRLGEKLGHSKHHTYKSDRGGLKPKGTFYQRRVVEDRRSYAVSEFERSVNGVEGKTIGQRAVLFNADGSVTRGANAIRDQQVANELAASIPSKSPNTSQIPATIKTAKPEKTRSHKNKAPIGQTNDLAGGVAAVGGITAMVAIVACLLPMHFVTSAITFLTSITTFFTNVNNTVNTYLAITEALLGIFGFKNATKGIKGFITKIVDNAFGGPKNAQAVKAAFASGVNSVSTTTKLLERMQSIRQGTDNKVDGLAIQLGTVNNSLKDAGLVSPDSPYFAASGNIDEFVKSREQNDPTIGEALNTLTAEIKDPETARKALAEEASYQREKQAKADKKINDLAKWGAKLNTKIESVDLSKV